MYIVYSFKKIEKNTILKLTFFMFGKLFAVYDGKLFINYSRRKCSTERERERMRKQRATKTKMGRKFFFPTN